MQQIVPNSSVNEDSIITDEQVKALAKMLTGKSMSKLTKWHNEPKAEDLMSDYTRASASHSATIAKISDWLELLNSKSDKTKVKSGRSGIAPKVIRRLAEWRYSSLASSILNEKNLFNVTGTSAKHLNASIQNTLVLNYQFNNLIDKVKFINDLVRTMVNEGTGIVRIGWEVEQQIKEKTIPVYQYVQADLQQMQMIQQVLMQIAQEQEQTQVEDSGETETFQSLDPDLQESIKATTEYGLPIMAVNTGQTQVIKELVDTKNRPSVKVINTADLVIDPTCEGDFSKAKFVVYKYQTDLSELKAVNQKHPDTYKNLDALDINKNTDNNIGSDLAVMANEVYSDLLGQNQATDGFKFKDDPRKKLTVFEYWGYWDIDGTGVVQGIVASICNGKLIKLERNPFPDGGLPFVVIPYMPVKGSVYGEPDAELVADNQQIIQALTRSIIDINARSANGQIAMPKGFLDSINMQKFRRGEDYEYNPSAMHPAEAIFMHTANEIPQSIMALIQAQYAESEAVTGVKSFQGGIDGGAYGQVVAGMSQAITAMNQREGDIIFRISKGLEKIGEKILRMNLEWLDEEEVIAVTRTQYVTIRKEDLQGDFFLQVELKSNSEAEGKAQQLTFMAQTLGQDADWGLRKMMLLEIGQLYNMDTFVTALQEYEPQPDPIAQEKAQLENEILKAKLAKEQAEVEYFNARSNYIASQIGQVQADTDLKNLDFLEQQDGVKHERQKELMQAQAEAQNAGKIASEMLKGKNAMEKAKMDNLTKAAIAKANGDRNKQNPAKSGKSSSKSGNKPKFTGQSARNFRKLPNPELNLLPEGLNKANVAGSFSMNNGTNYVNK